MIRELPKRIIENVGQVVVGKAEVVELLLVALLCEGHVLIEDVPGIGKTTLAKALAQSLGCTFRRIQFTPDLLPSDVTGIQWFNQRAQAFEFRPGPILSQIVLADEINRATPRTQSAMLEAMQERQVTVDGETLPLPRPFMVLATQNPIELEGTFPLPEAQIDRFLMQVALGYPTESEEHEILLRFEQQDPLETLEPVIEMEAVQEMQQAVQRIRVAEPVRSYIVNVVRATREDAAVELGSSPRGSMALYRTAQALAFLRGREYVIPDDVKHLTPSVLTHRVIISTHTRLRGRTAAQVVQDVIEQVPVPVEEGV